MKKRSYIHMYISIRTLLCAGLLVVAGNLATGTALHAQNVTTPMTEFGHNIGDDYWLATYTELTAYWQKLASESPRMVLDTIGYTAEGRPHLMAIITSPANHANLEQHKTNARRLALANDISEAEARELSQTAKAVVWIDGGLHATEVLGAAQLMEMAYQMVSLDDAETQRFLDDVVTLLVHANPDGMELVSGWYMREPDPMQRSTGGIPRLYQKYVGHDNNRDSYMVTQPETENISRIMFREWYPQIMYNHHQTGPSGTVLFAPPFRDPPNHNVHPLVTLGIQAVGTAMHQRLVAEGKPGATMRQGANYSAWFNGNLRTTSYFHNMIGILTETQGNPTPMRIQFVPNRLLADAIEAGRLPELAGYPEVSREVRFRDSRLDLMLLGPRGRFYVEAKSVTLVEGPTALFPDAPTERGRRHMEALAGAVDEGHRAAVAFVIQRADALRMAPNDTADPLFGDALREASRRGVETYAYTCRVGRREIEISGPLSVRL